MQAHTPRGRGLALCLHRIATTQARTSNPVPITFPSFSQCMEAHGSTEHTLYIFETNHWSYYPSQRISLKNKKVHCWLCPSKTQNGKTELSLLRHAENQIILSDTFVKADTDIHFSIIQQQHERKT